MGQERGPDRVIQDSKLDSIQVLRGIAALYVTVYHLKEVMRKGDPFQSEIEFISGSGPAGVSLFFVISGFIMVYITRNTVPSGSYILRFIGKRIIRIWPAYAIITLLYCFLQSRMSLAPDWPIQLVKSLLFIPLATTPPPFYGYATLNVGWSLNYEIYFYLVIAFSMLFTRFRWPVFFIMIAITLIGVPSYFGAFTLKADKMADLGNPYLNMITNPIIWNFVLGVIGGLLYIHDPLQKRVTALLSVPKLSPLLLTFAVWQFLSGFWGGFGPLEWGAGSTVVFFVFLFYYQKRVIHFPAWLVRIGDISFSIYLLHVPVVVGIAFIFRKMGFPMFAEGTALFFLSLALTFVAANWSYEFLELRLSSSLRKWSHTGQSVKKNAAAIQKS